MPNTFDKSSSDEDRFADKADFYYAEERALEERFDAHERDVDLLIAVLTGNVITVHAEEA